MNDFAITVHHIKDVIGSKKTNGCVIGKSIVKQNTSLYSSMVELSPCKRRVVGSNPTRGSNVGEDCG